VVIVEERANIRVAHRYYAYLSILLTYGTGQSISCGETARLLSVHQIRPALAKLALLSAV